jgi:hypothetical protein
MSIHFCASAKIIGDGSGSDSSSSWKKCFHAESLVKMLICDNCEDSFHVSCCNPRVKRIPVDEWLCRSCLKNKEKIPKETIIRKPLNIIHDMGRCRNASSERLALLFNLLFSEFQIFFFFFFAKIECDLYLLDRFDVLISKMIFKK